MKLTRLGSTTQHLSAQTVERARHAAPDLVTRVEAMEGIEGDRQRSLQQEIAEVDPRASGPFEGEAHHLADARQVAAQLTLLGSSATGLLRLRQLSLAFPRIDDKA
jgi:hypothetical protein